MATMLKEAKINETNMEQISQVWRTLDKMESMCSFCGDWCFKDPKNAELPILNPFKQILRSNLASCNDDSISETQQ